MLPPAFDHRIADVHEFDTDIAAISLFQGSDQVAKRHLIGAKVRIGGRESAVHICFGQAVERRFKLGDLRALSSVQRVKISPATSQESVSADDGLNRNLLFSQVEISLAHRANG